MKKRKRKLSKLQKIQRSQTEFRVGEFLDWCARKNEYAWISRIKKETGIKDNLAIKKALDRMKEKSEVIEVPLQSWTTDSLGRQHKICYKSYRLTTDEEFTELQKEKRSKKISNINSNEHKLKKLRNESRRLQYNINNAFQKNEEPEKKFLKDLDKVKTQLTKIRYHKLDEKHERKNLEIIQRKNFERKKFPDIFRIDIFRLMIDIDYYDYDEKKILAKVGLKKRTYESQIKRSTRLQWLQKKLIEYKNENKELPFEKKWGEYQIHHSLVLTKREFMYTKPYPRKKLSQWFRKKKTYQ